MPLYQYVGGEGQDAGEECKRSTDSSLGVLLC